MDIERKALKAALAAVGKAVSSRPGIPALTGVLVEAIDAATVSITATDLEVSARVTLGATCDVIDYPAFLVPFKALSTIVRAGTSNVVTLEHDEGRAFIDGAVIRLLPVDDFPVLVTPDYGARSIGAGALADVIRRVEPFASRDEARPVLTGVLLRVIGHEAIMVATDSFRLAVSGGGLHAGSGPDFSAIIPARALKALAGIIGRKPSGRVDLAASEYAVSFRVNGPVTVELTSRVIEGEFPNYAQLLPPEGAERPVLTYGRDEMADALKSSAAFTGRNERPIRLSLNGHVIVSVDAPDLGRFSADLDSGSWSGDDLEAGFNASYLADAITATDGGPMSFGGPLHPVVLTGMGVTALVMPVRLPA